MLLLFAPHSEDSAVPGPRRAAGAVGPQFLPQSGIELYGMQLAERGRAGRGFSPPPLPRAPLERDRTGQPPPRPRRPRVRQAPPFASSLRLTRSLRISRGGSKFPIDTNF